MPLLRRILTGLTALCLGALTPVAQAQTRAFKETFTGASTVNANPASPASPTSTAASYQQVAAKPFNPNPPAITEGNLRFGIVATSSGFNHVQALFTEYPVTLANAGDYIELQVVFSPEGGIITPQTNSTLFFGLFDANQVQPIPGGMNGNGATAVAGYAEDWVGYVNRIFHAGGNNGFFTRPARSPTGANNQDVLYNYGGGATIATTPSTLAAFTANATYTEVFRITKTGATSLSFSSSLYSGATAAGTPLYSQAANSSSTLTAVYDALAFGWRATGSVPSVMNVKSVTVTTTGTTTIIPEIITQPLGVTKSVGEAVTFSVVADGGAGTALTYQWRKDGADIPGATGASHTIPGVALSDAGDYTVVVTDVAGSTTSDVAALTVTTGAVPPSIIVEPEGGTIIAGGSHTFAATVNGTSPITYQWERSTDGGPTYAAIAGATGASYTLSDAALGDAGLYRLVATNAVGSATSAAAALAVHEAPTITQQPTGGTVNLGGSTTLSVTATGTPTPTYQWKKDGNVIPGATGTSHTIPLATGADTGNYTVVVANAVAAVTSAPASVAVVSPTMAASAFTPAAGDARNPDARLTITFNEAPTAGVSGYLRIYDAATDAVVDTIDLVAATALRDSLRASSTISTQSLPVQKKPIGGIPTDFNYYPITISGNTATIHPRDGVLARGKTYYVKLDAGVFVNAAGEAYAGIADATTWRFSTKAAGPAAGATTLTVAADGSGDFDTVQAALDFIPANNLTPTTIRVKPGTYFEQVGFQAKHYVTIIGGSADETVIAYPNNNTFNNVSGVYHRSTFLAQSVHDFTLANLTIYNTTPQNGSQAEAIVINGTAALASRNLVTRCNFFSYQDTVQINRQAYVSDCTIWGDVDFLWGSGPVFLQNCDIRILRTVGYFTQIRNSSGNHGYVFVNCRFSAPAGITGTYLGRIDPAFFPDSEVAVLDSTFGDASNNAFLASANGASGSNYLGGWWLLNNTSNAASAANVHNWTAGIVDAGGAALGDPNGDAFTNMPADATTQANYRDAAWVLNTTMAGAVGGSWTPALAPVIAVPPASLTVNSGEPATFSVTVVAIPAATYQWRRNGADIPGATGATYTIPAAHGADTGLYTVVVGNSAGVVESEGAILTVEGEPVAPVIIDQPESQLVAEGADFTLSVSALGTAPMSYQWQKNGSPITGATASTYAIVGAALADSGAYTVVIANPAGETTSQAAAVTVKGIAAIAPTGFAADVTGGAGGATVTVSTLAELKTYAETINTPYVIIVSGTIDLGPSGRIKLQANKTLRGATVASTILGSINISNVSNVIVSNLNISADTGEPASNDGITIANSTRVLITKCTIYNCTDGNLDVINGSDLVTVSWCKFHYTRNNGHNFSNLIGSNDSDVGSGDGRTNYRVTWHHNWWTGLAKQRMLACRFGQAHMFNNHWDCAGNDYCTESRNIAAMFSEHNHYAGVKNPLNQREQGRLMTIGNVFDACTGTQATAADLVFTPSYSYGLAATASVPEIVKAGAGNTTTDAPTFMDASIASSAAVGSVGGNLTLTAAPAGFTPVSYQWRFNNAAIAGATAATLELPGVQPSHAGAYTVVLGLGDGDAVVSAPFALEVQYPPAITTQPAGRGATVGDAVSFTVAASGDAPLAYQWHKNGGPITGATGATLTLPAVTTADAGNYHCVVTNAAGSAASDAAALTVQKATATVTVENATTTYDGTPKTLDATTTPAGLPVVFTYQGSATAPADAGSYTVTATIEHADYVGSGSGTLVINPAAAGVAIGNLSQTYDGAPKSVTVMTTPAGLPVGVTYAGSAGAPIDAGSYAVTATVNHANYVGSGSATLVVGKAAATISLSPLVQAYDGAPKSVTAITTPAGLTVGLTYDGNVAAPVYPGPHEVVATVDDQNYVATQTDSLVITITALVRHAPTLDGMLDGSAQVLTAENVTLNGSSSVSGDFLVPGTPSVRKNGQALFVGTLDGPGAAMPADHTVTLNGKAVLSYVVRRIDAIELPVVPAPATPAGTRAVTLNKAEDVPGDFATLRDLTLQGSAGRVAVPPGAYGDLVANGNTGFILGVAGATEPAVYDLEGLTLNGNATLEVVGPVILTLANGVTFATTVGHAERPDWLVLRVHDGGVTLNGQARLHALVTAPSGAVAVNGSAELHGRITADRLSLNGQALLEDPNP